jgi:hypothetical protein
VTDVIPTSSDEWSEQRDEIRRAKEEIAGPVPLIPDAPNPRIDLPRGIFVNEAWQRQVLLRELTGSDEEALARTRELSDFFDAVIAHGVVRIGTLDLAGLPLIERQSYLQRLLIGERDQLFLGVVKTTYGSKKTLSLTCRFCEQKQDLNIDLDKDFPPVNVAKVEDTSFFYTTSRRQRLEVRPAIGEDQIEVLARKGATVAEQNTILMSRCILNCDGELLLDPVEFARSLSMRDRRALMDRMVEQQPRVDLTVTVNCVACREEISIELGWSDLFRP